MGCSTASTPRRSTLDGSSFPAETTFRSTIRDAVTHEALGYVTFSVYFESGGSVGTEDAAGALRDLFSPEGLSLDQFQGLRSEPLDWPENS
jgi:hypothetical protein